MHLLGNIEKNYGCRSGLLRHWSSLWQRRLGFFRAYQRIDWQRVDRLVFVCRGNVCRSPYAEFRARAAGLCAASFGLYADAQKPAHEDVIRLASEAKLDLSAHRSRRSWELAITRRDLLI